MIDPRLRTARRRPPGRLLAGLLALALGVSVTAGCGGGDAPPANANPANAGAGSNWDQMNWDQGTWS